MNSIMPPFSKHICCININVTFAILLTLSCLLCDDAVWISKTKHQKLDRLVSQGDFRCMASTHQYIMWWNDEVSFLKNGCTNRSPILLYILISEFFPKVWSTGIFFPRNIFRYIIKPPRSTNFIVTCKHLYFLKIFSLYDSSESIV